VREPVGGDAESESPTGVAVADPIGLGHHAAGDGGELGAAGSLLLPDCNSCGDQCEHQQDRQHTDGAGAATPFAILGGTDPATGRVEEHQGLSVQLDERRRSRGATAVIGYPQRGHGGGKPLVVPEVVLGSARTVPLGGCLFDAPGGTQRAGDLGGCGIQGSPPGEQDAWLHV
jgi:hypothetical protein